MPGCLRFVPGGGIEPPFQAPKARVLPLDDPGLSRRLSRGGRPRHDERAGNAPERADPRAVRWRASATTVGPAPAHDGAERARLAGSACFATAISGCRARDRLLQIVEERVPEQHPRCPSRPPRSGRPGRARSSPPSSSHHRYASGDRVGKSNGLTTHQVVDQTGRARAARPARAPSPARPRASPGRQSRSARRSPGARRGPGRTPHSSFSASSVGGRVGASAAESGRDRDPLRDPDLRAAHRVRSHASARASAAISARFMPPASRPPSATSAGASTRRRACPPRSTVTSSASESGSTRLSSSW